MKMKLNKKRVKNLSRDVHSVQLSNTDKVAGGYMANISGNGVCLVTEDCAPTIFLCRTSGCAPETLYNCSDTMLCR